MIVNRINSNLVFRRANYNPVPNTNTDKPENTLLVLKEANPSVRFERNGEVSKKAEPAEKNFMKELKYKLRKAYAEMIDVRNIKDDSNIYLSVLS